MRWEERALAPPSVLLHRLVLFGGSQPCKATIRSNDPLEMAAHSITGAELHLKVAPRHFQVKEVSGASFFLLNIPRLKKKKNNYKKAGHVLGCSVAKVLLYSKSCVFAPVLLDFCWKRRLLELLRCYFDLFLRWISRLWKKNTLFKKKKKKNTLKQSAVFPLWQITGGHQATTTSVLVMPLDCRKLTSNV